ncbi:hypothetical protein G6F46_000643 [Rhizopus delemar]|uniref:Uncharacterized protein n=2 Tax=Rhizopus TaxID=4842 RepID=A0A9P6Z7W0_9FUNG|nr:hypothetical protein G6F43_001682 [Rhizopus delemar]KAG1166549.1 hypothetical protein G6F36_012901 [Rhizopus arrhizus]KAG1462911.1 hypothetical protein G6F55_002692 [Rhizopus delemar]KAG1501008.1 hypothetical protein G6F54_003331 [Rhizopus delemar]KAG1517777.1 hypothetical protein G6F53_001095 [Rhizopus delemar]
MTSQFAKLLQGTLQTTIYQPKPPVHESITDKARSPFKSSFSPVSLAGFIDVQASVPPLPSASSTGLITRSFITRVDTRLLKQAKEP